MAEEKTERGQVIRDAKALILALLESWHIEGRINPVSALFLLKNIGFYRDVQDFTVEARQEPAVTMSRDEIAEIVEQDIPVFPEPEPAAIADHIL